MPTAEVRPVVIALVLKDAKPVPPDPPGGRTGDDDRAMSGTSNHRIGAVGLTLKRVSWMGVNVRDDRKFFGAADFPKSGERVRVKDAHAAGICLRIKIVVVNATTCVAPMTIDGSQDETARLMATVGPDLEFCHAGEPQLAIEADDLINHHVPPCSRSN